MGRAGYKQGLHYALGSSNTIVYSVFLRSGELCIPADCSFDEGVHLAFADASVDSLLNPSSMRIRIKPSRTDRFRQEVDILVGWMGKLLCPVSGMFAYLVARGMLQDGKLFGLCQAFGVLYPWRGLIPHPILDTAFAVGQRRWRQLEKSVIQPSRCWVSGRAWRIRCTSKRHEVSWLLFPHNWQLESSVMDNLCIKLK